MASSTTADGNGPLSHTKVVEAPNEEQVPQRRETDEQYARDVRTAFAGVPKLRPQWVDKYMTILVVGESGLGKTTFIQNMFAAFAKDAALAVNDASAPTAKDDFVNDPEKLCTEIVVRDQQNQVAFHYRVQDSPGYDNMEVNMDPVLDYIHAANQTCLRREQDARRAGPLAKLEDPRVDVCVYFIAPHGLELLDCLFIIELAIVEHDMPVLAMLSVLLKADSKMCFGRPHRLKPVDCKFITKLAKLVPVIPVLAKADSMTAPELTSFRHTVSQSLLKVGKDEGKSVVYEFPVDLLREAGVPQGAPPFAVVSSTENDLSIGNFWPVREYPWGRCEALSSRHSDMPALKKLLFEVAYHDLKDATEKRYYTYREQQLLDVEDPSMLGIRGRGGRRLQWQPQHKKSVKAFLGKTLKFALTGSIFYLGVAFVTGGTGRLQSDANVLKERGEQAVDVIGQTAGSAKGAVEEKLLSEEERAKREDAKKKPRGPFGIFGRG